MYDMEKTIETAMVSMQWHGAPTRVLVRGEGAKRDVETGDVLKVTLEQARELVKYSHLWTLEGDEPVKHGFEAAQKAALAKLDKAAVKKTPAPKLTKTQTAEQKAAKKAEEKAAKEKADAEGKKAEVTITKEDVEAMESVEEVMEALESLDIKVNPDASLDEMKSVLLEAIAE